jgi:hypothetical protein
VKHLDGNSRKEVVVGKGGIGLVGAVQGAVRSRSLALQFGDPGENPDRRLQFGGTP